MRRAAVAAEVELRPDKETVIWLREANVELTAHTTVAKLMQRPNLDITKLAAAAETTLPELSDAFRALTEEESEGVVSRLRYAGYIDRQQREAEKSHEDEDLRIPSSMIYALPGLSREMTEKLTKVQPISLGQAGRIPGVTPAAIAILRMHLRRGRSIAPSFSQGNAETPA
jgi:tRNA uridine 5-carboxymethylaminomethyl modification enzyme